MLSMNPSVMPFETIFFSMSFVLQFGGAVYNIRQP